MSRDLSRLLRPKSIALLGGGWAVNVVAQLQKSGYEGDIWPVNPKRSDILGIPCFPTIDALPGAPDACFIGVNREASIDVVRQLSEMGAGGATCFASGFSESEAEGTGGTRLQQLLVEAAGDMPILGPNCYGLINYLDNVTLWPDQHGGQSCDRGVAIIAQSSNIAINMTMQQRGLPVAYVIAAGNQAQTGVAEIATELLADPRVSAIGLYLEGFGDIAALEEFAIKARAAGKPVVALKVGRSEKARAGTRTHTASLAGSAAAASALLKRFGFIEVRSIGVFLETLKLMDMFGPLTGNAICSVSCSGGEASLMADMADGSRIAFRDFSARQYRALKDELGAIVTIANPLDYHTFIWGDTARMTRVFAEAMRDAFDLAVFVLDLPRSDRCDPSGYFCAVDAIIAAKHETGARVAVLTSLPENLTETAASNFRSAGIVTLNGMEEAILAIDAAIGISRDRQAIVPGLVISSDEVAATQMLSEADSKAELARHGLALPRSAMAASIDDLVEKAGALTFPLALKGLGIAHKSEAGAVVLDIADMDALREAGERMAGIACGFLAEEMVTGTVAEILVGVTRDATGTFMLTIGAGGVQAELLADTASVMLPAARDEIREAIGTLKLAKLLAGWRGRQAADIDALLDAIMAIASYACANAANLVELDVNPLMAMPNGCIAVDALIITRDPETETISKGDGEAA
ncbi:MAG: acetate--CoA ligase family protein [Nitratireductor sp.]|nr:acetate--CoA ligase family protein [Nitratireductor sp.]